MDLPGNGTLRCGGKVPAAFAGRVCDDDCRGDATPAMTPPRRTGLPLFVVVNPTGDFFDFDGVAAVREERGVRRRIEELARCARRAGAPLLFGRDLHEADDKEFTETGLPPHGLAGSDGAELLFEVRGRGLSLIPPSGKRRPWFDMRAWRTEGGTAVLEKTALSLSSNPAFDELVRAVQPVETVLCGAVFEHDLKETACWLTAHGRPTVLADGALGVLDREKAAATRGELLKRGVRFESAEELWLRVCPYRALT